MQNVAKHLTCGLMLVMLAASIGCGPPEYYKLSGTVTKDGVPVPFLQITLSPVDPNATRPPLAVADEAGNFEMTTGRNVGVPPGSYWVHIEDPSFADGGKTAKESDPFYDDYEYVCLRYSSQNSDLKYEADQHRTDFELKLDTSEPSKPLIPLRELENTTDTE